MKLDNDFVQSGISQAIDNGNHSKYNRTIPNIERNGVNIKLTYMNASTVVGQKEEVILWLLVKYEFLPSWLIEHWYDTDSSNSIIGENGKQGKQHIREWIDIGLVWVEPESRGIFIRPTYSLFSLFNLDPNPYTNLPTNLLQHSISEISASYDIMTGQNKIINKLYTTPRQSVLGLTGTMKGTNIIFETDFRNPGFLLNTNIFNDAIEKEIKIDQEIKDQDAITEELKDFRYFSVLKKVDNTGDRKKDYVTHIPDMIIPVPRDHGKPRSIAIEMELTSKGRKGYKESIFRYKNNNKFGTVIYFCIGSNVADALKHAYRDVNGAGSTQFILADYLVPAPSFDF